MVRTITEAGGSSRRRIVIAGEMLELGPDEAALHREAGREISRAGVDVVWGVRGLAAEIVAGAKEAGLTETRFFETSEEAASAIVEEVREGDLVLVKGSRGVATEKIVGAIRERFPLAGSDGGGKPNRVPVGQPGWGGTVRAGSVSRMNHAIPDGRATAPQVATENLE